MIPVTAAEQPAPAKLRRARPERAARAVLPACGAAWTAAEIMHVTGIPSLDLTLGAVAASGVAYGKWGHRAAVWAGVTGGWAVLASRLGPLADPALWCPLTWSWAALSFCGWWQARRHPAVVQARDKRFASADWLDRRNRWGLKGSHLLDWEPTRLGERYLVHVKGTGKRARQIAASDVHEVIAEDLDLPPSRVRVVAHHLAGRVEISIRRADPWARPPVHPLFDDAPEIDLSGSYSARDPAVVGEDPETGNPLSLPLWDERGGKNVSIVGLKGAGKTVLLNDISERVTAARDAVMIRVNLSVKGLAEARRWGPACHLTAFGRHQGGRAVKVLRVVNKIIEWRSQQVYGTDVFIPSPGDPMIVVIMDEAGSAMQFPAVRNEVEEIARRGREYGVTLVRADQRGTVESAGSGNIRANDDVFCLGMVNRASEAMHAAGDVGLMLPNMATYGEGRAGVWAIAELDGGHQAGRTFMLKEPADIARIAAERAWHQPDLKPELKTFLGKSYEELLSTDVFAQWARDQQEQVAVARQGPGMAAAPDGAGASPSPVAVLTASSLDVYDQEAEDALPDDLRARWRTQGRRLEEIRREVAEAAAAPAPELDGLSHDELVVRANARWREVGEKTVIPDEARPGLLDLVAARTTASQVAGALGVTSYVARTWLERLRFEGLAHVEGKGRATRWAAGPEPGNGDAS